MAKRSRRERRQEPNKPTKPASSAPSVANSTEATIAEVSSPTESEGARSETTSSRKAGVNFGREYFYVYQEVRNVFVVAILMFVVLFALSFVI